MLAELSLTTTSQIRKLNTKAHLFCFSQTCVFCFQVVEASAGASALPIPSSGGGGCRGPGGENHEGPGTHVPPPTHSGSTPKGSPSPCRKTSSFKFHLISAFAARQSSGGRRGLSASSPFLSSQFYQVLRKMT